MQWPSTLGGNRPDTKSNPAVIAMVEGGEAHPRPAGCDNAVFSIITQCTKFQPSERPSFAEIRVRSMAKANFQTTSRCCC